MNEVIKAYIDTYVKENGNEEITGAILNSTLNEMVSQLYAHRCYGVITPFLPLLYADDIPAWGIASQNGTYTYYGGIKVSDELALIVYDGGTFTKQTIISKAWINNLANDLNNKLIGTATIGYNSTLDVVEIKYANGTVLQVGREQVSFVYNDTESTIINGTPVYYSGVGGSGVQMPTIAEADASNLATAMVKGHTTLDIPANSYGIIVCKGEMTVESHGLTVGSKIYLGVGGGYVTTPPSNPNLTIELGIVLDANTLHVYPCIISTIFHTDLSNLNSDSNFLHVTSGQITAWNNKLDSVSIPLSNTIFADSINGNDTSGDGTIIKPYKTLTKVIDSYTYQTVLGYVTTGNANVTGVSDVDIAKVKIGDKLKFSGMTTYGHTVISITLSSGNNTIVTNTNFATSSGVELSVYTEKLVKAFGTFNIDASIEKDGLFWDFKGATLIVGNTTAFNITSVKNSDFVVRGGKWLKIHANSKIIANNTTQRGSLYYSGDIPIDETSNRFANYYIQTNESLHSNLFIFENNTNIGNIATNYSFNPTTKINRATVTGNVVITLPTYPSSQSVSVMLKLTQGGAGGYDITFQDAINLSQFIFTDGTVGQRTWVTLLWDGEEWCFTASAWKDAVV